MALVALGTLPALTGCFATRAAAGQLRLINDQRPLGEAIGAESDAQRRAMLAAVGGVRGFARDVLQLRPGRAYSGYYATETRGLTYVVIACERTRFEPYTWWFPVAGTVAYKSHFDEASALAEAQELSAQGYDTWVGHSRAYSTLGIFRDPVVTTMMRGGLLDFVEVLIHEMTHARFYVPGQTDFNEQLASFVARVGTEQLLAAPRYRDTGLLQRFRDAMSRRRHFEDSVQQAIEALERLYGSGGGQRAILAKRQGIFDTLSAELHALSVRRGQPVEPDRLVMNNARLMQWRRYGQSADYLERLWAQAHGSWPRFWQQVAHYAQHELEAPSDG